MLDAHKEIAPRLRGLRDALDLTEARLAEMAGVTEEQVRLCESGEAEIPVGFLMAVAHACGVDLSVLISGNEAHLKKSSLVKKGQGLNVERRKSYDYRNLAYKFRGRKMEPFLVTVPPFEDQGLSKSTHPGQEFIHLLEGRMEVGVDERVLVMEPGDSLYFDSTSPHWMRGLDGKPATFLDVII